MVTIYVDRTNACRECRQQHNARVIPASIAGAALAHKGDFATPPLLLSTIGSNGQAYRHQRRWVALYWLTLRFRQSPALSSSHVIHVHSYSCRWYPVEHGTSSKNQGLVESLDWGDGQTCLRDPHPPTIPFKVAVDDHDRQQQIADMVVVVVQ